MKKKHRKFNKPKAANRLTKAAQAIDTARSVARNKRKIDRLTDYQKPVRRP